MSVTVQPNAIVPSAPQGAPPPVDPHQEPDRRRTNRATRRSEAIDDVQHALEQARAELEAEEAGQSAAPAAAVPATPPAPQGAPASTASTATVPLARFQAVNTEMQRLRSELQRLQGEASYWQGVAEARKAMAQAPSEEPTTGRDQPANANHAALEQEQQQRLRDAAAKYDEGAMTMTEFVEVQVDVAKRIEDIRNAARPAAEIASSTIGLADQLMLDRQIETLNRTHPWVTQLNNAELMVLRDMVLAGAAAAGKPFGPGPRDTMRLRAEIARLAQMYGPVWHPELVASVPAPQAAAPAAPAARPPAQAGGVNANKMEMADRHPPDPNSLGSGAPATGDLTDSQILALSPEDYAKLPAAMRQRLRGSA